MINSEEKQTYVSPRVKTVEIGAQGIICGSGDYKVSGQDGIWEEVE